LYDDKKKEEEKIEEKRKILSSLNIEKKGIKVQEP
jgi:hypothetical protein